MTTNNHVLGLALLVVVTYHVAAKAHATHVAALDLLATYRPDPGVPVEPRRSRNPLIAAHQGAVARAAAAQAAPTPYEAEYLEGSSGGSFQNGVWVPDEPSRRFTGRSV